MNYCIIKTKRLMISIDRRTRVLAPAQCYPGQFRVHRQNERTPVKVHTSETEQPRPTMPWRYIWHCSQSLKRDLIVIVTSIFVLINVHLFNMLSAPTRMSETLIFVHSLTQHRHGTDRQTERQTEMVKQYRALHAYAY